MFEPNPDRAHDPVQAAIDTLVELGHVPGDDPVTQLHQLAGDLAVRARQAQAAVGDLTDPDNRPHITTATAFLDAASDVLTALLPIIETYLDTEEQQLLAARFGLDAEDGRP